MIKHYIEKIEQTKSQEKMQKLSQMFEDLMWDMKDKDYELYNEYKMCLYELACGHVLSEEMAQEWICAMKPFGMKWNIEQVRAVIGEKKLQVECIDFWAIMNAMYNDYNEVFEDNLDIYVDLSVKFLNDADAKPGKTYNYWKYLVTK